MFPEQVGFERLYGHVAQPPVMAFLLLLLRGLLRPFG